MLPYGADEPGDSVTDALTWATHWPPPADLTDPASHPEHWQPIAELFTAPNAAQDTEATIDRLRATGWGALADALEQPLHSEEVIGALDAPDRAVLTLIRKTRPAG